MSTRTVAALATPEAEASPALTLVVPAADTRASNAAPAAVASTALAETVVEVSSAKPEEDASTAEPPTVREVSNAAPEAEASPALALTRDAVETEAS
jgi:hypothetical protein